MTLRKIMKIKAYSSKKNLCEFSYTSLVEAPIIAKGKEFDWNQQTDENRRYHKISF